MKKNTNKNVKKFLGFATLSMALVPLAIAPISNLTINTRATEKVAQVKQVSKETIFEKNLAGQSNNDYKSTLTLSITNDIALALTGTASATPRENMLYLWGVIDFSNATKKEEMKAESIVTTESGTEPGTARGFTTSLTVATSEGESALQTGVPATVGSGEFYTASPTDYKLEFAIQLPSFDSYYNVNLFYAPSIFVNKVAVAKDSVKAVKVGSSFNSTTKIYTPFSVVSSSVASFSGGPTTSSFGDVNASIYIDPQTYYYFNLLKNSGNYHIGGGLAFRLEEKDYIVSIGTATVSETQLSSNNLLNATFTGKNLNFTSTAAGAAGGDVYEYNETNPFITRVTTPLDLSTISLANVNPYFTLWTSAPGFANYIQIAQPIELNTIATTETAVSEDTKNDGTISVTAKAHMVNSTYTTATTVTTTIGGAGNNAKSPAVTLGKTVPTTNNLTLSTQKASIGFYNVEFALKNNNISSQQTVYSFKNDEYLDSTTPSVIPPAEVTTNFSSNGLLLTSEVVVDTKTVSGKTSTLSIEKSQIKIFYDGKLIETKQYTLVTPFANQRVATTFTSSYTINPTTYNNLALFSVQTNLYYAVTEAGTTTTYSYPDNMVNQDNSTVATYVSTSNSGLSGGAIAGIVIGVLAAIGLLGWMIQHRKTKKSK